MYGWSLKDIIGRTSLQMVGRYFLSLLTEILINNNISGLKWFSKKKHKFIGQNDSVVILVYICTYIYNMNCRIVLVCGISVVTIKIPRFLTVSYRRVQGKRHYPSNMNSPFDFERCDSFHTRGLSHWKAVRWKLTTVIKMTKAKLSHKVIKCIIP